MIKTLREEISSKDKKHGEEIEKKL